LEEGSGSSELPMAASESSLPDYLLAGGVLAIAVVLCLPGIHTLSYLWESREFYGHAYAIPPVAAYLVYVNRRKIGRSLRRLHPQALGPLVAFGAAAFEVSAVMGDAGFAAGLGIPLLLGAVAYAIGSFPLLRSLALPLGFLAMMVPPPHFFTDGVLFRLKLFVTNAAVSLLQAGGKTVTAEGNQILVPGQTLFVADACSGLTSIVTLLPLACIIAYFLSRGIWRRVLVVASVIPLALGSNILRVIVTVQLISSHGIDFAQGLLHESVGTATYVLGTLALIGVARVLR